MASLALHVIAGCTDRKRLPTPAPLRLGSLHGSAGSDRFAVWWRTLERDRSPTRPAAELYAGDHWSVIRELPGLGAKDGLTVRLWVASAGYGLVPADAPLRSYAATFTPGHADSVGWRRYLGETLEHGSTPFALDRRERDERDGIGRTRRSEQGRWRDLTNQKHIEQTIINACTGSDLDPATRLAAVADDCYRAGVSDFQVGHAEPSPIMMRIDRQNCAHKRVSGGTE